MRTFAAIITVLINYAVNCAVVDKNIVEMFHNDSSFHDQFIHFIEEQERQWLSAGDERWQFENSAEVLRECAASSGKATLEHIDNIALSDIAYYTEMGDLSFYCEHNFTRLRTGMVDDCDRPGYKLNAASMDKYFRIFNPNLTVIQVSTNTNLTQQVQDFAEALHERNDSKVKWKLAVIMLGIKGEKPYEIGPMIMQAVQKLSNYERTLIVVARIADSTLWDNAKHAHKACQILLGDTPNEDANEFIWTQIASHLHSQQRRLFGVEILSLNATLEVIQPTTSTDLTAIGYDCYHFSSKGLSMFHTAIWNQMLTKDSLRSNQFRPHYQLPKCIDPQCPFIRTKNNSALCNWNFPKADRGGLRVEEWIAIGIFATAVTLCAILLIALCCGRGRDQVITETLKPVGADWSCITKFIDEDSSIVLNYD